MSSKFRHQGCIICGGRTFILKRRALTDEKPPVLDGPDPSNAAVQTCRQLNFSPSVKALFRRKLVKSVLRESIVMYSRAMRLLTSSKEALVQCVKDPGVRPFHLRHVGPQMLTHLTRTRRCPKLSAMHVVSQEVAIAPKHWRFPCMQPAWAWAGDISEILTRCSCLFMPSTEAAIRNDYNWMLKYKFPELLDLVVFKLGSQHEIGWLVIVIKKAAVTIQVTAVASCWAIGSKTFSPAGIKQTEYAIRPCLFPFEAVASQYTDIPPLLLPRLPSADTSIGGTCKRPCST